MRISFLATDYATGNVDLFAYDGAVFTRQDHADRPETKRTVFRLTDATERELFVKALRLMSEEALASIELSWINLEQSMTGPMITFRNDEQTFFVFGTNELDNMIAAFEWFVTSNRFTSYEANR